VETIKRQTRAAYGCLVAGESLWAQAQPTAYMLYARCCLSHKSAATAAVCGLWLYVSVIRIRVMRLP